MEYEWDEAKRRANLLKHGVDFADVQRFEWNAACEEMDRRRPYGENRWRSFGLIDGVLHLLVYTVRNRRVRVISLRKANRKEMADYAAS